MLRSYAVKRTPKDVFITTWPEVSHRFGLKAKRRPLCFLSPELATSP